MKIVLPIIGIVTVIVQVIRFWPFTFTTLLSALVTGGVFYIACKLGWDTQKGRILQDGFKGWGDSSNCIGLEKEESTHFF